MSEKFVIGDYVFDTFHEYREAQEDVKKIDLINRELDIHDPEVAVRLYNKIRDGEIVFRSPIGKQFFDHISDVVADGSVGLLEDKHVVDEAENVARRQRRLGRIIIAVAILAFGYLGFIEARDWYNTRQMASLQDQVGNRTGDNTGAGAVSGSAQNAGNGAENAGGKLLYVAVDPTGNPVSDADGNVIHAEVDADGNPLYVTVDSACNQAYDKDGNPVYAKVDMKGKPIYNTSEATIYGSNGNLLYAAEDESGKPIYDAEGNPVYVLVNGTGNPLYVAMDKNGKPLCDASGNVICALLEAIKGLEDASGNPILATDGTPVYTQVDPSGKPIGGALDANGNAILDVSGNPVSVTLDANGNPILDANGNLVSGAYDANGNPISGAYDANGNPISGAGTANTGLTDKWATAYKDPATQTVLSEYADLYSQNTDFAGWISIDGTSVNYPVMQTSDNQYYLKKDYFGKDDSNGTLFIDYRCDIVNPTKNTIIYGHNMKSGKMFGSLDSYLNTEYYEAHRQILFDTRYEHRTYEVVAVCLSKVEYQDEDSYRYYNFIDAANYDDFLAFYRNLQSLSVFGTEIDLSSDDQILTLSTCNNYVEDGRLFLVAKRTS